MLSHEDFHQWAAQTKVNNQYINKNSQHILETVCQAIYIGFSQRKENIKNGHRVSETIPLDMVPLAHLTER